MTPLYWASDRYSPETQQYLLRMAAIPFGIATVVLAFLLARTLFPGDKFLAMAVPTFVAFQPQISYEASMVNNDILAIALYSLILYLVVVGIRDRFPIRTTLVIGLALGLALLTKGTALTVAPVIALAILLAVGWKNVRGWIGRGALVAMPAAVLAAPWYVFLYRTYGNLDGLDQIEALQYWNNPAGTFFGMLTDRQFVIMRFRETWGEFGWRDIPLSTTLLWIIAIPTMLAIVGLVRYLIVATRREPPETTDPVLRLARWQWIGLAMLGLVCVISYLAVIQFGTRFALTQARYFFPAVNAGTLLLMLGLRTIIPKSFHGYAQGALFAALFLLNAVILTQYVIPHYLSL
jgi:4-amino-4-deoxy-L-arabinose transferase-like glycosyltransferase